MNTAKIDSYETTEDFESRREHERYSCNSLNIRYRQIATSDNDSPEQIAHAQLNDISLKGLAITSQKSFNPGDILSVEIKHDDSRPVEILTAVIMWCKPANDATTFQSGLRVVATKKKTTAVKDTSHYHRSHQNQLVCPSCNETSFFLRKIDSAKEQSDLYYCGHCGLRHDITDIMAFNRKL